MSSTQSRPHYDESEWVKNMEKSLYGEVDQDSEIPVTIFGVPKALMVSDPESYLPQQVAIGPYHHLRAELFDMERYKVGAARRNHKALKLKQLVDHLIQSESRIRASYHKPLGFGPEALAWMLALDASFLFEFLHVKEGKAISRIPSRMSHLIDLSGNKTAHNAILRDVILLENQIPLFVIRKLLDLRFSSETADENLLALLTGLSKDLSPFQMAATSHDVAADHLLHFLYNYMVPKSDPPARSLSTYFSAHEVQIDVDLEEDENINDLKEGGQEPLAESTQVRQLRLIVWNVVSTTMEKPIIVMKRILLSKPIKLVVKLPWTLLSNVPILKAFKQPLESMFSNFGRKDKKDEDDEEANKKEKPPLQEEIAIPSVSQLLEAGVRFMPTNEGISGFVFDERSLTLYIPVIRLDLNSEVVLRNLVAYEACAAVGPMVLTRYTELMNGIIDTELDARLLCERGIINNHLKSEKEVAELWNGMTKSVKLTRVPSLDKVIADVNRFYSQRLKVKWGNFMREYVFGSWRILTFLAAIVMVALMCLQAFCQVYSCNRVLRIKAFEPAGNH